MKLGIVGTGKIVQELLPCYEKLGVEQTLLLSTPRSLEKAQVLCAKYHLDGVETTFDALLSAVDTVYIALPNDLHYDFTRRALEASRDVLLEKPACGNFSQTKALFDLAKEKNCLLVEAVTTHQLPAFALLREAVAEIGPIREAKFVFCQYSSRYDDFLAGITHPVFDPSRCGGALYDLNVYNVHAALGLFGAPQAIAYDARIARGIDTGGALTLGYTGFEVTCLGAKDEDAREGSCIRGERGQITLNEPMSRITGFTLNGRQIQVEESDRMYSEFSRLLPLFRRRDFARAEKLAQFSLTAAKILEEARHRAGIRFPCDAY